jgi:large repetitive protein
MASPEEATRPRETATLSAGSAAREDLYGRAEVVLVRNLAPDVSGTGKPTQRRERLLRLRGEKYPLVRVEETVAREVNAISGTEAEVVIRRVAMVADHVMVSLPDTVEEKSAQAVAAAFGLTIRSQVKGSGIYLMEIPRADLDSVPLVVKKLTAAAAAATPAVDAAPILAVEPDYLVHAAADAVKMPNDARFGELWGMHNTGQTGGTADADIDAPTAWAISTGSPTVKVAVIDTGISYTHPDLAGNIWSNIGETNGNGIDDDGNGYVDDVRGWNFVNDSPNANDDQYHGTHCAGTIGARGNDADGVVGVSWQVSLIPLKFLSSSGSGVTSDAIAAIRYATRMGCHITSNSWGGGGYSSLLKQAIDAGGAAGVICVAAAGNDSSNIDLEPTYPAAYDSPAIVSVAASTADDGLSNFSNYGKTSVDLAAPGSNILSTAPGGGWQRLSGTSMATPHVAGALALLKAVAPSLTVAQQKDKLLQSVDRKAGLTASTSGGRLNVATMIRSAAGPIVQTRASKWSDATADGASGDADGVMNPGEGIVLLTTFENAGSQLATNVRATLSLPSGVTAVTITQGNASYPDIPAGGAAAARTPFRLQIASNATTPLLIPVKLTIQASPSHQWTEDIELQIYRSVTMRGRVTARRASAPLAGATVSWTGPRTGSATTGADGRYSVVLIDGTYAVSANAAGYLTSAATSITLPPANNTADFALGQASLAVAPSSLDASVNMNQSAQRTLTVTNSGDSPLTFSVISSYSLSSFVRAGAAEPDAVGNGLPFFEDFEASALNGWAVTGSASGLAQLTNTTAVSGVQSLRLKAPSSSWSQNGVTRALPRDAKPKTLRFSVRPGSMGKDHATFSFADDASGPLIDFRAGAQGTFKINTVYGAGDSSYPYEVGRWYDVELRNIDWVLRKFDVAINGFPVRTAMPFLTTYSSGSQVSGRLTLSNYDSDSESWWDNVVASDGNVSWLAASPTSGTVAAGASTTVTVTLNAAGLIAADYTGALTFSSNASGQPQVRVPVTLRVQSLPNTAPRATAVTASIAEDAETTLTLAGTDAEGNLLQATVTVLPAKGTLHQIYSTGQVGPAISTVPAVVLNPTGQVRFVPAPNESGTPYASLIFTVSDGLLSSAPAAATVNVAAVNDAPIARNDSISSATRATLTIAVLANDSDADGTTPTIQSVTPGGRGATSISAGVISYVPNASFTDGFDLFTYTIADTAGATATATVTVRIGLNGGGDWTTYGGTQEHAGYVQATLGTQSLVKAWSLDSIYGAMQPTVVAGRVYATVSGPQPQWSSSWNTVALDAASGAEVWRRPWPNAHSVNQPTFHRGRLYVQRGNHGSDSQLWCLSALDGTGFWNAPFGAQWEAYEAPAVSDQGVWINGGHYGGVYGFSLTGQQLFFNGLEQYDRWTPTLGADGTVYSYVAGNLRAHHPTTGTRLWELALGWSWNGWSMNTVTARSGNILVASGTAGLHGVNLTTRTKAWTVTSGAANFIGSPCIAQGIVYAYQGTMFRRFDLSTGSELPGINHSGNGYYLNQIIVTDDSLISSDSGSTTQVYDLASRTLRQTIPFGGRLAFADGTLYIGGARIEAWRMSSPANGMPVAISSTATLNEDTSIPLSLNGTDPQNEPVYPVVTRLPLRGTLYQRQGSSRGAKITNVPALVQDPGGVVIYAPESDGFGTPFDSIGFKVSDNRQLSAEGQVEVTVTNINDAPVAVDDVIGTRAAETAANIRPLINDIDVDGETPNITTFSAPSHGTLAQTSPGIFSYTPGAGFAAGGDSFTYTIRDAAGLVSSAKVMIEVGAASGTEWQMLGNTPNHAGYVPATLGTAVWELHWRRTPHEAAAHQAAIGGGMAVVSYPTRFSQAPVVALDLASGAELWRQVVAEPNSMSQPTYVGGRVYYQHGKGIYSTAAALQAVNAADGSPVWTAPVGAQWETYAAPTVADGSAWVNGGSYGGMYGFNLSDGSERFFKSLSQVDQWAPAYDGSRLYAVLSGVFGCYDPATGDERWRLSLPQVDVPQVVVGDGRAYFNANIKISDSITAPGLYCIHLNNQAVAWTALGAQGMPAVAQGVVYAVSDSSLKAYKGTSGAVLLTIPAPVGHSFESKQPIVTNDLIFASALTTSFGQANPNRTLIFDRYTGTLLQTLPFGGNLSLGGDRLIIASPGNDILAYGRPQQNNRLPQPLPATVTMAEDATLPLTLEGTDADNDPLGAVIMSLPATGKLFQTTASGARAAQIFRVPTKVAQRENTVMYVPDPDGAGQNYGNFTFALIDGFGISPEVQITIHVSPVNDAPVAEADYFSTAPGIGMDLSLLANDLDVDGDTLEISEVGAGTLGQVSLSSSRVVRYQPGTTSGIDTFTYNVRDPAGVTSTATVTVLVNASAGRDWTMLGNSPTHSGYTPVSVGTAAWQPSWTVTAPVGTFPSSVAIENGTVAVSMNSRFGANFLMGLTLSAGAELWRKDMGPVNALMPPAVSNGFVFVQNGKGTSTSPERLSKVNLTTGTVAWQVPWSSQWENYLAPIIADGKVWIGGGTYGGLYAFNEATGAQLFFTSQSQTDGWTPTYDGASVYTCLSGVLKAHHPATGVEQWKLTLQSSSYGSQLVVAANPFVLISLNSEIVAVNTMTRQVAWRREAPLVAGSPGQFSRHLSAIHGEVYAQTANGPLMAYALGTGAPRRTYTPSDAAMAYSGKPIITNDAVFLATGSTTEIFDRWTAARRQIIQKTGEIALAGGRLLISSQSAPELSCYGRPAVSNQPPVATAGLTVLDEDQTALITLAGSDPNGDAIKAAVAALPTTGRLYQTADGVTKGAAITNVPAAVLSPNRQLIYDPGANQRGTGIGSFAYFLSDEFTNSATVTHQVNVIPMPDAPVAGNDLASTQPGQLISPLGLLLNDIDVDGEVLTITGFTQPQKGQVTQTPSGDLSYLPQAGFTDGTDTFSYTISDPTARLSTANVTISVSPTAGQAWPTFGGGPAHDGYVPASFGTGTWPAGWTAATASVNASHQPAIQDGVVCVSVAGSAGISVLGLNASTGVQLWSRPLPSGSINPPTLHRGKAYVQRGNHGSDTQLIALNAANGSILWQAPHGAQWESYHAPAVTDNGVWINGGHYGGLYGFTLSGSQNFFLGLAQYDRWTPTIGSDGTVYSWVAGQVAAHHPTQGTIQWSTQLGWDWRGWSMGTVSALSNGRLFLIGSPGLHALDLTTHQALWSNPEAFSGSPAVAGGAVFAMQNSVVKSYNVASGAPLMTYSTGGSNLTNQPIITNDLVFAASPTQTYIFDRQGGQLLHTLAGGAPIALAGKTLYTWGAAGTLMTYSAPWAVRFSPNGGSFDQPVDVIVTAADPAAIIHYSLDGTAPEFSKRTIPSASTIRIEATGPLLAVAISADGKVSPVAGVQFTITDSDADGVPDWWERATFGALTATDGRDDVDRDGINTLTEFRVGTNPTNGQSALLSPKFIHSSTQSILRWPSVSGRAYVIECSDDIKQWTAISNELRGTGAEMSFSHPSTVSVPKRFYRVRAAY